MTCGVFGSLLLQVGCLATELLAINNLRDVYTDALVRGGTSLSLPARFVETTVTFSSSINEAVAHATTKSLQSRAMATSKARVKLHTNSEIKQILSKRH